MRLGNGILVRTSHCCDPPPIELTGIGADPNRSLTYGAIWRCDCGKIWIVRATFLLFKGRKAWWAEPDGFGEFLFAWLLSLWGKVWPWRSKS